MKRSIPLLLAVSALCLGAALSSSCQKFFSASPLESALGRDGYGLPEDMTLSEMMAAGEQAISSGDAELAETILDALLDEYPDVAANRRPAILDEMVQLALLTTDISGAVTAAMKMLPSSDAELTAEQSEALRTIMKRVSIDQNAGVVFDLLSATPENTVSGSDHYFSGLALIQSVVCGSTTVTLADLSPDNRATVEQGQALIVIGRDRLIEEGCDQSVIDSLGTFMAPGV